MQAEEGGAEQAGEVVAFPPPTNRGGQELPDLTYGATHGADGSAIRYGPEGQWFCRQRWCAGAGPSGSDTCGECGHRIGSVGEGGSGGQGAAFYNRGRGRGKGKGKGKGRGRGVASGPGEGAGRGVGPSGEQHAGRPHPARRGKNGKHQKRGRGG